MISAVRLVRPGAGRLVTWGWAIVKFNGKGAKSYETKLKLHR
jgi:hypothetical protein